MNTVRRGLGYIPDPSGHKRTPFDRLATRLGLGGSVPKEHLIERLPPVLDQGAGSYATGSCTGHALAIALSLTLGFVPSPAEIYRNGRGIDRLDPLLQPLTDNGARPNQVYRAVNEFGVKPMESPTPDGRLSDAYHVTINDEPMLGDLLEESTAILVGDYEIYSVGLKRSDECAAALSGDKLITAAIAGGSQRFQEYKGGILSPLLMPLDHYVVLTGYTTLMTGERVWRGRNSWSENWGVHGDFWLDEDALQELGDVIVADVKRKL